MENVSTGQGAGGNFTALATLLAAGGGRNRDKHKQRHWNRTG